jgi:hypothetical protein
MQKYHSIADVTLELRKVAEKKTESVEGVKETVESNGFDEKVVGSVGNGGDQATAEVTEEYDSPDSEITDSGN